MDGLLVVKQTARVRETFVALLADERPLAGVHPYVLLEIGAYGKAGVAMGTLVGSVAQVGILVVLEVVVRREGLAAGVAGVRPVFRMDLEVLR